MKIFFPLSALMMNLGSVEVLVVRVVKCEKVRLKGRYRPDILSITHTCTSYT